MAQEVKASFFETILQILKINGVSFKELTKNRAFCAVWQKTKAHKFPFNKLIFPYSFIVSLSDHDISRQPVISVLLEQLIISTENKASSLVHSLPLAHNFIEL